MRGMKRLWARLGNVATGRNGERRLREEIETHLALQTEENIRAGMTPEEARWQAVLKFGPMEAIRESSGGGAHPGAAGGLDRSGTCTENRMTTSPVACVGVQLT